MPNPNKKNPRKQARENAAPARSDAAPAREAAPRKLTVADIRALFKDKSLQAASLGGLTVPKGLTPAELRAYAAGGHNARAAEVLAEWAAGLDPADVERVLGPAPAPRASRRDPLLGRPVARAPASAAPSASAPRPARDEPDRDELPIRAEAPRRRRAPVDAPPSALRRLIELPEPESVPLFAAGPVLAPAPVAVAAPAAAPEPWEAPPTSWAALAASLRAETASLVAGLRAEVAPRGWGACPAAPPAAPPAYDEPPPSYEDSQRALWLGWGSQRSA